MLVDAFNVMRSGPPPWPGHQELVDAAADFARSEGAEAIVVFDGRTKARVREADADVCAVEETPGSDADTRLAQSAATCRSEGVAFWLATSDRELRVRAGDGAKRILGGRTMSELLGLRPTRF